MLGSGGPIPDDARASSGYLVWSAGKARLLVDAGGGVFQRFGASGARIEDLDAIALTHLHADHSSDVAALLKGGYFAKRTRPLALLGPAGNDDFPSMREYIDALLAPERGAYRYLSPFLTGQEGYFPLLVTVVDVTKHSPEKVFDGPRLGVEAVGVHHGHVPAVGYVVTVGGKRIGFGGDQSDGNTAFEKMASGADLLILHMAVPDGVPPFLRSLHATPRQLAGMAARIGPKRLLLSHLMQRSLAQLERNVAEVQQRYAGPVVVAEDEQCLILDP